MTGRRPFHAAAIAGAFVAAMATSARGDALRWDVATDGDACDRPHLAREVQLACDALGSQCAVVMEAPDRRAVLRCPIAGPWTVDVYDAAGRLAWTFALDGDDRVRRAAIWIARTTADSPATARAHEAGADLAEPAPDATTGAKASGASPAVTGGESTPAPAATITALPRTAASESNGLAHRASSRPWGLLGAARIVSGTGFGPALGGVVQLGWLAGPPDLALTLDVAGERSLASPNGYSEAGLRVGAGASYGAPWGSLPVGVAIEGGALAGDVSAPATYTPSSLTFVHAFARACVAAQLGGSREWRPYAGLSLLVTSPPVRVTSDAALVASSPSLAGSLDVGVAWQPR